MNQIQHSNLTEEQIHKNLLSQNYLSADTRFIKHTNWKVYTRCLEEDMEIAAIGPNSQFITAKIPALELSDYDTVDQQYYAIARDGLEKILILYDQSTTKPDYINFTKISVKAALSTFVATTLISKTPLVTQYFDTMSEQAIWSVSIGIVSALAYRVKKNDDQSKITHRLAVEYKLLQGEEAMQDLIK